MKKPRDHLMRSNKNRGSRNRQKGQDLERQIARDLRELGFTKTRTSRAASKLLDDCGVDIVYGPPYLIQAKSGYQRNRPKYELIYEKTKELLAKNLPDNSPELQMPIVLIHKLNGRGSQNFVVTLEYIEFLKFLEKEAEFFDLLHELSQKNVNHSLISNLCEKYGIS